jgi:DNA-binding HxlR family transcriptional regulator
MYQKKIPEQLDCGLSVAVKILGGKWKSWILACLREGKKRPSELQKEMSGVSPRVISMQLKELETFGVISKNIYAEIPLRVEYYITELGQTLYPVMDTMEQWGMKNRKEVLNEN